MAFKFKDLTIQVAAPRRDEDGDPVCTLATAKPDPDPDPAAIVPCTLATMGEQAAATRVMPCTLATMFPTPGILGLTGDTTGGVCTLATMFGAFTPNTVTTVMTVTTVVQRPGAASLRELKEQLQQALAEIERQEREQEAAALPRSVEEADELERRLKGALQELQDHRRTLENEAPKGASKKTAKEGSRRKPRK
jgi:hypothetical protein